MFNDDHPPDSAEHLDLGALFAGPIADVWLEIGFGGGEHTLAQARQYPTIGMIGCEPYVNGVASLLDGMDREGLSNIRIHADDARELLMALPDDSIGKAFILFPDPWPKRRHHKRRIVNSETLDALARILRPGGELRMATDDPIYATEILALATSHLGFGWTARRPKDWQNRPTDWPQTRYETKAVRAGRPSHFYIFRRNWP